MNLRDFVQQIIKLIIIFCIADQRAVASIGALPICAVERRGIEVFVDDFPDFLNGFDSIAQR